MKKFFTAVLAIIFTLALVPTPAIHIYEVRATTARGGELIEFGGRDWRVLDVDGNHALILHETVITDQPYHHTWEEVTWETSSSRAWLNDEFLNSFSAEDRARIRETNVINDDNPWTFFEYWHPWTFFEDFEYNVHWNKTAGGANTTDRIFLLSIDEVVKYFGDSGMVAAGADESNRDMDLEYPNHGIYDWGIHDRYSDARIARDEEGSASWWWLRSPGGHSYNAAHVNVDGILYLLGHDVKLNTHFGGGLRPALWLNLESSLSSNQTSSPASSDDGDDDVQAFRPDPTPDPIPTDNDDVQTFHPDSFTEAEKIRHCCLFFLLFQAR
jgi:hypothetical protein